MNRLSVGVVSMLLGASGAARAQEPAAALPGRMQDVGEVDARVILDTDIVLAFLNGGVGADVGVARLGPGTLSVGGEFEAGTCFTACFGLELATGWSFSHAYYAPQARVAYHYLPGNGAGLEQLDLYGLLLAGVTFSTTRVSNDAAGAAFDYRGSDVAPAVGLGVGGKYFLQEAFFVGAEARLRISSGEYTYTVQTGSGPITGLESTWSVSGLNVQLFGGLRF